MARAKRQYILGQIWYIMVKEVLLLTGKEARVEQGKGSGKHGLSEGEKIE